MEKKNEHYKRNYSEYRAKFPASEFNMLPLPTLAVKHFIISRLYFLYDLHTFILDSI